MLDYASLGAIPSQCSIDRCGTDPVR